MESLLKISVSALDPCFVVDHGDCSAMLTLNVCTWITAALTTSLGKSAWKWHCPGGLPSDPAAAAFSGKLGDCLLSEF